MLSVNFRSSCVEWPGKCQCHLASFSLSLEMPQSISGLGLRIWVTCPEGSIYLESPHYPTCCCNEQKWMLPPSASLDSRGTDFSVPCSYWLYEICCLICASSKMAACKAKSVLFCWNLLNHHATSACFNCCLKPQILWKDRGQVLFFDSRGCCVSLGALCELETGYLLCKIMKLWKLHWKRSGNLGLCVAGLGMGTVVADSWQKFI